MIVGCGAEVQFDEDGANVRFHGLFSDEQTVGDGVVGPPLSHQGEDGLFSVGESVQGVTASGTIEQLRDDCRVDDEATSSDLSYCVCQLFNVSNPVLEKVAGSLLGVVDELQGVMGFNELGQDEHADRRVSRTDDLCRLKPLQGVTRRHADVNDHHVGLMFAYKGQEVIRILCLSDYVEAGFLEQVRDAFPK